jgi:hypothetical protein
MSARLEMDFCVTFGVSDLFRRVSAQVEPILSYYNADLLMARNE